MKKYLSRNIGITLIALVISIIVFLILAGVTIATLTGQNEILSKAEQTRGTNAYRSAEEQVKLAYMAVKTEIMTKKASDGTYDATDEAKGNPDALVTIVTNELKGSEWRNPDPTYNSTSKTIEITYTDTSLREGMEGEGKPAQNGCIYFEIELDKQDVALSIDGESSNGGASRSKLAKLDAVNSQTGLQEVAYKPAANSEVSVVIPSDHNGGAVEQTFTQANLGIQDLKWYVLSSDENGVNLVSDPTSKTIKFQNAGGYDNCLYYLNEIATKLCTNESLGIVESRVHALRLTDIKTAAEKMNGSSYNWDYDMVRPSNGNAYNNGAVGTKVITPSKKRYPQIYGTDTGEISTGNPMYDEEIPSNFKPISGDIINGDTPTSATASTLRVNYTYFSAGNNANTIARLGDFGKSDIAKELFNSSGTNYWFASRCVGSGETTVVFSLCRVLSGYLNNKDIFSGYLANSNGDAGSPSYACRFVVSIPLTKVNITDDGAVTLK